jgi:Zn-finger nucleic acid-binding protein
MSDTPIKSGVYNCPNCGAAASPTSVRCAYCHSSLATAVCSSCYGAIFTGMKHCPWCGGPAAAGKPVAQAPGRCPRCDVEFVLVPAGGKELSECPACGGLWVENTTLQQICTDHEKQEAVMGFSPETPAVAFESAHRPQRMYIPCPECKKLMNRRQFAGGSGIIVDWCKPHGTWFDCDELKRAVEFIRAGGFQKAREREKSRLDEERATLHAERLNVARIARLGNDPALSSPLSAGGPDLIQLIGGIWKALRD